MEEYTAFEEILKWEVTDDNQQVTDTDANSDKKIGNEDITENKPDGAKTNTPLAEENGPMSMHKEEFQNGNYEKNMEDVEEEKLKDSIKRIEETGLEAFKGFDATIKKEVIKESQNLEEVNHRTEHVTNQGDAGPLEENEEVIVTVDSPHPKVGVNNGGGDDAVKGKKQGKQTKKKRKPKKSLMDDFEDDNQKKYHLCKVCKISFRKEKKLLKHIKKYHSEPSPKKKGNLSEVTDDANRVEEILKVSSNLSDDINALLGAAVQGGDEEDEEEAAPPAKKAKYDSDPDYYGDELPVKLDDIKQEDGLPMKDPSKKPKKDRVRKSKKLYTCDVCKLTFPKKKLLKLHKPEHEVKKAPSELSTDVVLPKVFTCKMCCANFTDREEYINHSEEHRKDLDPLLKRKIFPCEVCGATFTKKWNVKKHMMIHLGQKKFECEICDAKFATSSARIAHMVIHSGKRPFRCEHCQAAFNQKGNLTKHLKIHTGEKPFKCYYCQAAFNNSTHMKEHIMLHTGQKPFRCEICNLKFIKEASYRTHQKIHLGPKPYSCDICGATFVLRLSFNMHMKRAIHNGDTRYKCKYCDLELTSEARYNNHIRKHEEPCKKHKCELCHAEFVMKCSLIRHQKIHTGERPFKCTICNAQFAQKFSLTVHERLHAGDMPFKCEICDAAYVTKSNYTSHMKLHTVAFDESPLEDYQMSMMSLASITSVTPDSLEFMKKMAAMHMAKALEGSGYEADATAGSGEEEDIQAPGSFGGMEDDENEGSGYGMVESPDGEKDTVEDVSSKHEQMTNGLSDDAGEDEDKNEESDEDNN